MIKYEVIKHFSKLHPNKLAIKDSCTEITWRKYQILTLNILSNIQKQCSFGKEGTCLFISKNSSNLVLLGSAFSTLGIPFSGIDYNLDELNLRILIKDLSVAHIFISQEFSEKFRALTDLSNLHIIEEFVNSSQNFVYDENEVLELIPNRVFKSYTFTSGTTGLPKIVFRGHSFDKRRFDYLTQRYKFNNSDIHLCCLPMYHVSSTGWVRLFLSLGCAVIIHNFDNGYNLSDEIHSNNITTTLLSPTMLKQFVEILDENSENFFPLLRFVITGGKNCSTSLKEIANKKLNNVVYEYYGTTETGINTLLDPEEAELYPGSVGKVFEGSEIVILDPNNNKTMKTQAGRIAIQSYMNMDGYINAPSNVVVIKDKKFLLTSDYGYFNDEGYLYILQRTNKNKKNVINYYAIENELSNRDYVEEVSINDLDDESLIKINLVPKKYLPYSKINSDVLGVTKKYGVSKVVVSVVPRLNYTLTGKIKLSVTA